MLFVAIKLVLKDIVASSLGDLTAAAVINGMATSIHALAANEASTQVDNKTTTTHAEESTLGLLLGLAALFELGIAWRGLHLLLGLVLHLDVVVHGCRHCD